MNNTLLAIVCCWLFLAAGNVSAQGYPLHETRSPSRPTSQSNSIRVASSLNTFAKNSAKNIAAKNNAAKNNAADSNKTVNDSAKKAVAPTSHDVNYDLNRDTHTYPIDPRKPCNQCVRPPSTAPTHACNAPGFRGRPYLESEPGGCRCGKKGCGEKHPFFSLNWPRPFSARLAERFPQADVCRRMANPKFQLNSRFDHLENFKLINYQRRDNGYCGEDADPYGCLGESRQAAVAGLQFRQPGQPLSPGR